MGGRKRSQRCDRVALGAHLPCRRAGACPPLADRINGYGAYNFSQGRCFLWNEGACNGDHTAQFLAHFAHWLGKVDGPVVILWDGAPCHRAQVAHVAATQLGFTLLPLPAYSPHLNPIEGLWKWMREEVTQHPCHATLRDLFDACQAFIEDINARPEQLIALGGRADAIDRLWPKFELDPDFEKLLASK